MDLPLNENNIGGLSNGIEHYLRPKLMTFVHVAYSGDAPIWVADHSCSLIAGFNLYVSSTAPVELFAQIQIVPWHFSKGQQW